jgi:hypothetical protein
MTAISSHRLDPSIQTFLNQSFVFALKALPVKPYEAAVNRVSQDLVERRFAPRLAQARVPAAAMQLIP